MNIGSRKVGGASPVEVMSKKTLSTHLAKINKKLAKLSQSAQKKIIKKVPPTRLFKILKALFIFDCVMALLYLFVLYDTDAWDNSKNYKDESIIDKFINRMYYSLMISSTIGPPSGFIPRTRTGKLLTIVHIYLSIMFLPFLLVAIIGIQLPFHWLDF